MATTKIELYNGATLVATKTSAPFTNIDWTPVTTGAATLTAKRYEDGVLVATSSVKNYTVNAAAGFSPASISPEYMWHKGDIATTDGATITTSTDSLSTTPRNLTTQVGTVTRGNIGGHDAIKFVGNGRMTTASSSDTVGKGTFSIHFKMYVTTATVNQAIVHSADGTAANRIECYVGTAGNIYAVYTAAGNKTQANSNAGEIVANTWYDIDIVLNVAGDSLKMYKNNVEIATNAIAVNGTVPANYVNAAPFSVGARGTDSLFWNGYVKNLVIQPVAYTSQNRIDLANLA